MLIDPSDYNGCRPIPSNQGDGHKISKAQKYSGDAFLVNSLCIIFIGSIEEDGHRLN